MTLSKDARLLWQTAQALALKSQAVSLQPRPLPPLIFITDPVRTPDPVATVAALPSGSAIIYRHFGASNAQTVAQDLREVSQAGGIKLLIGLDQDLAEQVKADGLHLPERALYQITSLRCAHPDWLITGAVHQATPLHLAKGLDAALVSPIFTAGGASATKPPLGLERFSQICAEAPCPVYALGGIKPETVARLLGTGACGLAGVEAIQTAFKPEQPTRT